MNTDRLTDIQLISLLHSGGSSKFLKKVLNAERVKRQISPSSENKLRRDFTNDHPVDMSPYPRLWRLLIVMLPFFIPIHALIAGWNLALNRPVQFRQHWSAIKLGLVIWTLFVIIAGWFWNLD